MSFLSRAWTWLQDQFTAEDDDYSDEYDEEEEEYEEERPPRRRIKEKADYVPGAGGTPPARAIHPLETLIMIPASYRDARHAVDSLEKGLVVILVLQDNVDDATASRFVDFMSGAVYLAKGDIKLINDNVLVCAPSTVRLETDLFAFHSGIPTWRGPDV